MALWLEPRTGDQGVLGWNPGRAMLRNFGNSVHPTSPCLSDKALKAVGPFYLASVLEEVKEPTQWVNV